MTKIIINGSHKLNGNTSRLIQQLFPDISSLNLLDYNIEIYNYNETYSDYDQFVSIIEEIIKYDEIIFATPVYWYSMSSLMKIFFDRITDLLHCNNKLGHQLKNKKVQVITSSNGNHLDEIFFEPFKETCKYLGMHFIKGSHYVNSI